MSKYSAPLYTVQIRMAIPFFEMDSKEKKDSKQDDKPENAARCGKRKPWRC